MMLSMNYVSNGSCPIMSYKQVSLPYRNEYYFRPIVRFHSPVEPACIHSFDIVAAHSTALVLLHEDLQIKKMGLYSVRGTEKKNSSSCHSPSFSWDAFCCMSFVIRPISNKFSWMSGSDSTISCSVSSDTAFDAWSNFAMTVSEVLSSVWKRCSLSSP